MIPIAIALLLTACQSSGLSQPDITAQTGPVSQAEETTQAQEAANIPEITAVPETGETAGSTAGLELPILDEINNNVTVATAGSFLTAVRAAATTLMLLTPRMAAVAQLRSHRKVEATQLAAQSMNKASLVACRIIDHRLKSLIVYA